VKKNVTSEIRINRPAQEIIKALIEQEHLKKWWGVDSAFVQKKDGGLYTLTWMRTMEGIKFVQTGKINVLNLRSHLYLEDVLYINYEKPIMGPYSIKFDVIEKPHYSVLKVVQNGFEKHELGEWYYKSVVDGWPQALMFLKNYLEHN
jgi:hypothetical protein